MQANFLLLAPCCGKICLIATTLKNAKADFCRSMVAFTAHFFSEILIF